MPAHDTPIEDLALRHVAVTELQTSLLTTKTVEDFLQQVVDGAAQHVAPRMSCTLTMLRQDSFATVASTDDHATGADQVEYGVDSGPCVDAAGDGVQTIVPDVRADDRWPAWQQACLRLGFL